MTSLTALAHTAAAAPAFNGLFYATVATVIPVLFLAVAVQGPFINDLLKLVIQNWRKFLQEDQLDDRKVIIAAAP